LRPIGRIFLGVLTALSFLLFLGTIVLWVRSVDAVAPVHFAKGHATAQHRWQEIGCSAGGIYYLDVSGFRITKLPGTAQSKYQVSLEWNYGSLRTEADETLLDLVDSYGIAKAESGFVIGRREGGEVNPMLFLNNPKPSAFQYPRYTKTVLSYWLAAAALAALPSLQVSRLVRSVRLRRRTRAGLCPACGYDLRATPDRCPECGAVPDPAGSTGGRPGVTRT
jgi:hypothetical protein